MELRIQGAELPGRTDPEGHRDVQVGVQLRNKPAELHELHPGDAQHVSWILDCAVRVDSGTVDVTGPHIQGGPGERFVYLTWVSRNDAGDLTMFRRAKLMLADVPAEVLRAAADSGRLVARLALTDAHGGAVCARVRPPQVRWSAG